MNTTPVCPQCGLRVPPDAPLGLCPRCLMNASPSATASYHASSDSSRRNAVGTPIGWPELLAALREVKLVSEEDLNHYASLSDEDSARLARVLVQAKKVTPYQAGGSSRERHGGY